MKAMTCLWMTAGDVSKAAQSGYQSIDDTIVQLFISQASVLMAAFRQADRSGLPFAGVLRFCMMSGEAQYSIVLTM
jgi:hypothetical protein